MYKSYSQMLLKNKSVHIERDSDKNKCGKIKMVNPGKGYMRAFCTILATFLSIWKFFQNMVLPTLYLVSTSSCRTRIPTSTHGIQPLCSLSKAFRYNRSLALLGTQMLELKFWKTLTHMAKKIHQLLIT